MSKHFDELQCFFLRCPWLTYDKLFCTDLFCISWRLPANIVCLPSFFEPRVSHRFFMAMNLIYVPISFSLRKWRVAVADCWNSSGRSWLGSARQLALCAGIAGAWRWSTQRSQSPCLYSIFKEPLSRLQYTSRNYARAQTFNSTWLSEISSRCHEISHSDDQELVKRQGTNACMHVNPQTHAHNIRKHAQTHFQLE